MVMFRPCKTTITAVETGRVLLDMLLSIGKLPSSIVSDRDVRFTSAAWGQLWRGLKTELKMSTAYHPQTDGQTERMNRTMQTLLRAYAEKRADWEEWLPFVAAAYNSSQQESTKRTPFELNFADARSIDPLQWALRESGKDERGVSVEAERTLGEMKAIWDEVRARAAARAGKAEAAGRQPTTRRAVRGGRQRVPVDSQPAHAQRQAAGQVGRAVRGDGGEVERSKREARPERRAGQDQPGVPRQPAEAVRRERVLEWPGRLQPNRPAPELVEGDTEWQVERVIGKKTEIETRKVTRTEEVPVTSSGGRVLRQRAPRTRTVTVSEPVPVVWYKLKWLGWDEQDATWQRESECSHCQQLVDEYELLMKQQAERESGQQQAAAAAATTAVELGLATVMQWRLTDKHTSSRRGQPTVRCSFASAGPSETERVACAA